MMCGTASSDYRSTERVFPAESDPHNNKLVEIPCACTCADVWTTGSANRCSRCHFLVGPATRSSFATPWLNGGRIARAPWGRWLHPQPCFPLRIARRSPPSRLKAWARRAIPSVRDHLHALAVDIAIEKLRIREEREQTPRPLYSPYMRSVRVAAKEFGAAELPGAAAEATWRRGVWNPGASITVQARDLRRPRLRLDWRYDPVPSL